MPKALSSFFKYSGSFWKGLTQRERKWILFASCAVFGFACYFLAVIIQEDIAETDRLLQVRTQHLEALPKLIGRYQTLRGRLGRVQKTFAAASLTFEGVTDQLDKIIRESIGSNKYGLKKGRTPTQIGFEYEKQEFHVNLSALSLEQVTKLLYKLEQGESPLFLGNVDINRSSRDGTFNATLEIFSVRKKDSQDSSV